MVEYIVKVENLAKLRKLAGLHVKETLELTSGKIVRCRDCKHFTGNEIACGAMVLGYECSLLSAVVEPDGFCAWGESK